MKGADPIQYSFSSQLVATGIPNSVMFTLDFLHLYDEDGKMTFQEEF
jgi:hypothetical protein